MRQTQVDKILAYYRACKDQIFEENKGIRKVWDQNYDQYLCKKDFGKKEVWQSKAYTPISKPKIKRAVRLIKRILISSESYFDFEHPGKDPERRKKCNITKRGLKVHLKAAKFLDLLAEALESGFTLALMIMKFWVGEDDSRFSIDTSRGEIVRSRELKLKCKPVNPYNFYFTRDRKIVIEDEWITLPELKKMASLKDGGGNWIYDKSQIGKLVKGDYGDPQKLDEDEENRLRKLGIYKEQNRFRKDVLLSHFWGPLINEDNEVVKENCHFTVANDQYLILNPKNNPFWHKKPPYVFDSPLSVLFRHIGKGLTEDVRGIESAIVDFVNMQMDNLMWKLLGVREIDSMALADEGKADAQELYPGKFVRRRTGYQGEAFKFHDLGFDPDAAMPLLQELFSLHEQDHGVTEYVEQFGGTRGEKATIYAGKKASAMSDFQSIAKDIERGFLVGCIDMSRDLMIQYLTGFDNDPSMTEIFKNEGYALDELSDDEKREMIVTDLDIIGRGISIFFERMEKIEKIGSMVKMYNALPEQAQDYIPWADVIKEFHDAFGFEKVDLKTDEEVAQIQAQRQQMQNQQMMMAIQQFREEQALEREKTGAEFQQKLIELQHESEENKRDRMLEVWKALAEDKGGAERKVPTGSRNTAQ
jgi:hypothetical protein